MIKYERITTYKKYGGEKMTTHFLDYKGKILDLRAAEKGAKEEKEKAILKGDKEAEKKWGKAEETARNRADKLEQAIR